jgi:hypothetical protein
VRYTILRLDGVLGTWRSANVGDSDDAADFAEVVRLRRRGMWNGFEDWNCVFVLMFENI